MVRSPDNSQSSLPTPLGAVLAVTFFTSFSTGVFWNGLSFIAKHAYDFDEKRNFILFAVMGGIYAVGAFRAAAMTRFAGRVCSPRQVLAFVIALQTVFCMMPVLFVGEWALWTAAIGVTMAASISWPLIESYISVGRHGQSMRSAIGWFNITWTIAVCIPLLLMAPILEHHAKWAIGGLGVINLLGLIPLFLFTRQPGYHDAELSADHVQDEYPLLLRSARVLLPLSYILMSAMTPILPYRLSEIGVEVAWETPASATWMIVRVLALAIMWRLPFWHGRWGTLVLGAGAMTSGFGMVVLAPNIYIMLAGFVIYGIGMGVIYYAALYYGMAVGKAAIEAAGKHEALIGAGYGTGPLAGLVGTALGGGAQIVAIVWGTMAIGILPAILPYVRARRLRKSNADSRGDIDPD